MLHMVRIPHQNRFVNLISQSVWDSETVLVHEVAIPQSHHRLKGVVYKAYNIKPVYYISTRTMIRYTEFECLF